MINVHLSGGVGNQAFQYATALALSKRLGTSLELDVSQFDDPRESRLYSLGLFAGVREPLAKGMRGRVIYEQGLPFNPSLFEGIDGDVTLWGYFQCEKNFEDIKKELQQRFVPRCPMFADHYSTENLIRYIGARSVFVTIRRTDYVDNPYHGVLPMEYYRRAAELLRRTIEDPWFFIFSDDPEWCGESQELREIFMPNMTFAGNWHRTVKPKLGREDCELYLMSLCCHTIGANSSYSWWGAWLGEKPGTRKICVFPKQWFGPNTTADARDIVPERWVRL